MPYLPEAATPALLNAFARRLAQQLNAPSARGGLMALREAFARAGGYPDAHALEAARAQDSTWRNPIAAIGLAPSAARPADTIAGIAPGKLFDWAGQAWKRYRPLLSPPAFGEAEAQSLLCLLWGHANWDGALQATITGKRPAPKPHPGLVVAPSLEALHAQACSDRRNNFRGLHQVLGRTEDGQWLGLDWSAALVHQLLLDDDRVRRNALIGRWIRHRVLSGDRLFLVDGSVDGVPAAAAQAAAAEIGERAHTFEIHQKGAFAHPHLLTTPTIAVWLMALTGRQGDPQALSWTVALARRWKAGHRYGESTDVHALLDLAGTYDAHWWHRDVGMAEHFEAQALLGRLDPTWQQQLEQAHRHFPRHAPCEANTLDQALGRICVMRIEGLMQCPEIATGRAQVALATLPWRDLIATGLGEPLLASTKQLIEEPKASALRAPGFCVHADIPMGWYVPGEAVLPAQSRSMGVANLYAGPSAIFPRQGTPGREEGLAALANCNTKLFGQYPLGETIQAGGLSEAHAKAVRQGNYHVIHRSELIQFEPLLDNP